MTDNRRERSICPREENVEEVRENQEGLSGIQRGRSSAVVNFHSSTEDLLQKLDFNPISHLQYMDKKINIRFLNSLEMMTMIKMNQYSTALESCILVLKSTNFGN